METGSVIFSRDFEWFVFNGKFADSIMLGSSFICLIYIFISMLNQLELCILAIKVLYTVYRVRFRVGCSCQVKRLYNLIYYTFPFCCRRLLHKFLHHAQQ